MKKIFISLLAVAALAACTKSEVQYEPADEISFAPVTRLNTKAAVNDTDYPDELNMYVFANAGVADAAITTFNEPYFANAEFAHGSHDPNVFGGVTPYYWPNVKELIFSGYSKSGNAASLNPRPTYELTNGVWEIKMKGYAPGTGSKTLGDNDLMWFPTTAQSYGKADMMGDDKEVEVEMRHACSWVTIKIKGDATTGAANTTWKILDLTIADLAQSGDVVLGAQANWTPSATTSTFDVYPSADGKALTTDYVDYTQLSYKDLIVIPQATKTLKVKYSYVSQAGGAADGKDIVIEEEKDIPLTYTGGTDWQPGVHYTYNITIGTLEILIEPTVKNWDTATVPDIVLQ